MQRLMLMLAAAFEVTCACSMKYSNGFTVLLHWIKAIIKRGQIQIVGEMKKWN